MLTVRKNETRSPDSDDIDTLEGARIILSDLTKFAILRNESPKLNDPAIEPETVQKFASACEEFCDESLILVADIIRHDAIGEFNLLRKTLGSAITALKDPTTENFEKAGENADAMASKRPTWRPAAAAIKAVLAIVNVIVGVIAAPFTLFVSLALGLTGAAALTGSAKANLQADTSFKQSMPKVSQAGTLFANAGQRFAQQQAKEALSRGQTQEPKVGKSAGSEPPTPTRKH